MFTGIIEDTGTIEAINSSMGSRVLSVKTPFGLENDKAGDSISVNGICLTMTAVNGNMFSADVSEETLKRTNLGELQTGSEVNLERALKVGDRLGGHIVTGHVDGLGRIDKREARGNSLYVRVQAERNILKLIVEKGSVALDGVSLTVNEVGENFFSVNIIPHTSGRTTITSRRSGDNVNIETDILGKYIQKLADSSKEKRGLNLDFLNECGFV